MLLCKEILPCSPTLPGRGFCISCPESSRRSLQPCSGKSQCVRQGDSLNPYTRCTPSFAVLVAFPDFHGMSHAVGTKEEHGSPNFVAFSQVILSNGVLAIGSTHFLRINDNRLGHKAAVGTRCLLGPEGVYHATRNAGVKWTIGNCMLQQLTESPALSSLISTHRMVDGDGSNESFLGIEDGCC